MVNPLGGLNVFNHSATKVNNKPNMHAWNLFGYFDRTLCLLIQLWLDIGQFVWNLAFYSPCVHNTWRYMVYYLCRWPPLFPYFL